MQNRNLSKLIQAHKLLLKINSSLNLKDPATLLQGEMDDLSTIENLIPIVEEERRF